MNKMAYYFCDVPLGVLEKTERGYAYTSNIDNEQELRDNTAVCVGYELWGSFSPSEGCGHNPIPGFHVAGRIMAGLWPDSTRVFLCLLIN